MTIHINLHLLRDAALAIKDKEINGLREDRRKLLDAINGELPNIGGSGSDRTVKMAVKDLAGLSDAFNGSVQRAIKERDAAEEEIASLKRNLAMAGDRPISRT